MLELNEITEKDYLKLKYRVGDSYCGLTEITRKEDGKIGYVDSCAHEVIPCIYEKATDFSEGYAIVYDNEPKVINTKGEVITVLPNIGWEYDFVHAFRNGLCLVKNHEGYNYINIKGEILLPRNVSQATEFSDGLAVIDSYYNPKIIDTKGNEHPELLEEYEKRRKNSGRGLKISCLGFKNGLLQILTKYEELYGYIFKDGRVFEETDELNNVYKYRVPKYLIERPVDLNSESLNRYYSDITYLGKTITLRADTKEELAVKKREFYRELQKDFITLIDAKINPQVGEEQGTMRKL